MKYAPTFKHHMYRYVYAMIFSWKRDVLDAGSKEGFGAQILSWVAKSITLSDISKKWLGSAERLGGYVCPTTFVLADFEKEFPQGEWDTVVAFEVIEHLENPEFFIKNIAEHLRKDGRLVFSVPHLIANHEHKHLYDEEKIRNLLNPYFDIVEFHVQVRGVFEGGLNEEMYKGQKCYVGVGKKKSED